MDPTETPAAMKQAYSAHLKSGAELLTAWHASLTPARAAELATFEDRGLRVAVLLSIPADRWGVRVVLVDAAGSMTTLATLEPAGSAAVN